jgi:hypothetical protein
MASLKCNRQSSNSWSTTNVLVFARGRAKGKLRRFCWRSLSTHLYHQHKSNKERTTCFYTHIPLLLTYFHLYKKLWHLAENYAECKWNQMKRRFLGRCNCQEGKEAQNRASPQHHQGLGPPGEPPREGQAEGARPRRGRTPYLPSELSFHWWCGHSIGASGTGWI